MYLYWFSLIQESFNLNILFLLNKYLFYLIYTVSKLYKYTEKKI